MRILCFESGGTKLVAALADQDGQLIDRKIAYREPHQEADATLRQLVSMGKELAVGKRISAVGFGYGGTVRRSDGKPLECYHEQGWERINFHESLQSFDAPVFVENDCNLAALAETHAIDRNFQGTLLYITIGTGIGAGLVNNGKLLELSDLGEAELGHLVVEPAGPLCPCGNRGCLETLCAGPGLSHLSKRVIGRALDAPTLMQRFRSGDEEATLVISQAATYLAGAIAAAVTFVAPKVIVLGGGVMRQNEKLLHLIEQRAVASVFPPFRNAGVKFQLSRLEEDVVCRGAALLCIQKLEVNLDI